MRITRREPELRYTLAVVYEPNVNDAHEDFAKAETIRVAAWEFMKDLQLQAKLASEILLACDDAEVEFDVTDLMPVVDKGVINDMHQTDGPDFGTVVGSFVAPVDMQIGDETVTEGTWCVEIEWTPEQFEKVKRGERTGVSLGGTACRVEAPA